MSDKSSAIVYITDDHKGTVTNITVNDSDNLARVNIYPLPRNLNGLRSSEDRLGYMILSNENYNLIEERVRSYLNGNGIAIVKE